MTTPNSQLPTPKASSSNELGEGRTDTAGWPVFTPQLRGALLGSWELEVGS
jgi:hypothetical protein